MVLILNSFMNKCISILILTVTFIPISIAHGDFQGLSPSGTVTKYCESDFLGKRLKYKSGDVIETETLLACYGVRECIESGYDTYYIINEYRVIDEKIYEGKAVVEVEFDIVCDISAYSVVFRYRTERKSVNMVVVNGQWRLCFPIGYPCVSMDVGISAAEDIAHGYRNASDPRDRKISEQLDDAVILLKIIRDRRNKDKQNK